ncbi:MULTISPECIES: hypothetical protein [Sphingopyxis]|uniref:hypothetical protein n=1 Tax=Sphingopyxis TaxID=165697 RepID=UPI001EED8363|nr:hypothetical protein [Sphingopyxis terrae]
MKSAAQEYYPGCDQHKGAAFEDVGGMNALLHCKSDAKADGGNDCDRGRPRSYGIGSAENGKSKEKEGRPSAKPRIEGVAKQRGSANDCDSDRNPDQK